MMTQNIIKDKNLYKILGLVGLIRKNVWQSDFRRL